MLTGRHFETNRERKERISTSIEKYHLMGLSGLDTEVMNFIINGWVDPGKNELGVCSLCGIGDAIAIEQHCWDELNTTRIHFNQILSSTEVKLWEIRRIISNQKWS
jgi:hypothetical protein